MMYGTSPRLVCMGNLTLDDVNLPDGSHRANCSGGNAFYAALSARLWEPATEIIAPVGTDLPKQILDQMKAKFSLAGIPARNIANIHNMVTYDLDGGRVWHRYTSEEDAHILSPVPEDIPEDYLQAEIFLVSAMTIQAQEEMVEWLSHHVKGLIALDIRDTYIEGNEDRVLEMVSKVDIFMPSEIEARRFSKEPDWRNVALNFSKLGPKLVVIKRGAEGVSIYHPEQDYLVQVSPYPAKVVDTTGAGDSFCGGFLANYLKYPDDLELCGRAGVISSSFTISDFGTEGILNATPAEARRRLAGWKPANY